MSSPYHFASLSRISDLADRPFELASLPREKWATGDYVAGEVRRSAGRLYDIELRNGRMSEITDGDLVIGALGQRAATLSAVGDWREIGDDLNFDMMTSAGLFGRISSKSVFLPDLPSLSYRGHLLVNGRKRCMGDFVTARTDASFDIPTILIIGTSMSAGKTSSGKVIIRELKRTGYKVAAAKLTGAGRYRDVLSMSDAGADWIFDFVDAGLPSTIVPAEEYRHSLRYLLGLIANTRADVLVAEAGASPLEPYNGATAMEEIAPRIRCTVLCASDPYAVAGICSAFERQPDLVAGGAANTQAGIDLVRKLTGIRALNLLDSASVPALSEILHRTLR